MSLPTVNVSSTAHLGCWQTSSCAVPAQEIKRTLGGSHETNWSPPFARQLKKHGQPRLQTLAMRRVRIAAWQMVPCPGDAKGRRYWEESVTWRCDEEWREPHITLPKEDYRNSTQWKRPLPGRPTFWERPFSRFFGDAWISKIKECKTWAEWCSLTKEFQESWHVMLNLKPPESSCASCDAAVDREKRPRDDSDPWTIAWCPDEHRRLEVWGDNKVVINWMSMPCLWVVSLINLCGGTWVELYGRELMRLIGVGTFSVHVTS